MQEKTSGELVLELVEIHCRTMIRTQRRRELLQEQKEDDAKFNAASSLLKPLLNKLGNPIHFNHAWQDHYSIRLADDDKELLLVEKMLEPIDIDLENDRLISDDCLAMIEMELSEMLEEETQRRLELKGKSWEVISNDGQ